MLTGQTSAQTTFQVSVVGNTHHPDPDAYFDVYEIDAVQGAELNLVRGETYVFEMNSVPASHPFYISTSDRGGDIGTWDDGVTNNYATGNQILTFIVPHLAPDFLYYQYAAYFRMGWKRNIINPVSAPDETPGVGLDLTIAYPNPSMMLSRLA